MFPYNNIVSFPTHNFLWGGIPPVSLSVTQTSIDFTSTNSLRGGILGFFSTDSCYSVAPSEQIIVFSAAGL